MKLRPGVVVPALGLLAAVALGDSAPTPRPLPAAEDPPRVRVPPRPPDWDLEEIRDIFRFADDTPRPPRPVVDAATSRAAPEATPAPPPGPRLVGLIRGPDGLRAALAADGEVVVLGQGESALGYTVVDVGEEGVLVRDPAGAERSLALEPGATRR